MAAIPADPPAPPAEARLRVKDIEALHDQIYIFLQKNQAVESTRPLEDNWGEISRCRALDKAFSKTVESGMLTLDQANRFILYMVTDVEPLLAEEVSEGRLGAEKRPSPFRADRAVHAVSEFFDTGVANLAGPEDDDEEGDSSDESGSGSELEDVEEGDEDGETEEE
jgi:hypothetical protein